MLGGVFERILKHAAIALGFGNQVKALEEFEKLLLNSAYASPSSNSQQPHSELHLAGQKEQTDIHGSESSSENKAITTQDFFTRLKSICGEKFKLSDQESNSLEELFGAGHGYMRHEDFAHGLKEFFNSQAVEKYTAQIRTLIKLASKQQVDIRLHFSKFDSSQNGRISMKDFTLALQGLGLNARPDEISILANFYADEPGSGSVSYKVFLDDMMKSPENQKQAVKSGAQIKNYSSTTVDIVTRLREFANEYIARNPEGYRELWFQMESRDVRLQGWISPESLVQAFHSVGYDIAKIDLRRLQARFSYQGMEDCLRYRDILISILAPAQLTAITETNPRKHADTNIQGLQENHFADQTHQHIDSSRIISARSTVTDFRALEFLTCAEMQRFLKKMDDIAVNGLPDAMDIDLRDVFEQFDIHLSGRISFSNFVQCLKWTNLITPDQPSAQERNFSRRLANHLQGMSEDDVDYRLLFVLLEDYRHSPIRKELRIRADPRLRDLQKLLLAFEDKARTLHLSNVSLVDIFQAFDTDKKGSLSHRSFHGAIAQLGVDIALVSLSRALVAFEVRSKYGDMAEIEIDYTAFAKAVESALKEDQVTLGGPFWDDEPFENFSTMETKPSGSATTGRTSTECKQGNLRGEHILPDVLITRHASSHLQDRFEFIKLLRQFVADSAGEQSSTNELLQAIRKCFDDLDVAEDGTIQVQDMLHASKLLEYSISINEVARVFNFPFLFYEPERKSGGWLKATKPRSPQEIAKEMQKHPRIQEMTFEAFCMLISPSLVGKTISKKAAKCSRTWQQLFHEKEETHYTREEIIEAFKAHLTTTKNNVKLKNTTASLLESFERYEKDFSGTIEVDDFHQALNLSLQMDLTLPEVRRIVRRLKLVQAQEQQPTRKEDMQGQAMVHCTATDSTNRNVIESIKSSDTDNFAYYRSFTHLICPNEFIAPLNSEDKAIISLLREAVIDDTCGLYKTLAGFLQNDVKERNMVCQALHHVLSKMQESESFRSLNFNQQEDDHVEWQRHHRVSIMRIVRRFSQFDPLESVDVKNLLRFLRLELSPFKVEKLRQLINADAESIRDTLAAFEAVDTEYLGSVTWRAFQTCLQQLIEDTRLSSAEVKRICERFEALDHELGESRSVDYREMIRFFTTDGAQNQGSMNNEKGLPLQELIRLSQMSDSVWRYLWNHSSSESKKPKGAGDGNTPDEINQSLEKRPLSFKQWKIQKDLIQDTESALKLLSEDVARNNKEWLRACRALVSTDHLVRIYCGGLHSGALEKIFITWSKKSHEFNVEGNQLGYNLDAKAGDSSNKEFVRLCKEVWLTCERQLRGALVAARIEYVDAYKGSLDKLDDREKPPTGSEKFPVKAFFKKYGPDEFQSWIRELENKKEAEKRKEEQEIAKKRKESNPYKSDYYQDRKKDCPTDCKAKDKLNQPLDAVDPLLQALLKLSYENYINAISLSDLEKCRSKVLRADHLFSQNLVEEADLKTNTIEKLWNGRRDKSSDYQQGADHQFTLWLEQKNARAQAESLVRLIDSPAFTQGFAASDRAELWRDVGRALKAIDAKGLLATFTQWSEGYATRAECTSTWNQLPPRSFAFSSSKDWNWVHLRSVLVKVISNSDINLAAVFQTVISKAYSGFGDDTKLQSYYKKMLRELPVDLFRTMLTKAGIQLRLHEEKRLVHAFPGCGVEGDLLSGTVNMDVILQITARQFLQAKAPFNPYSRTGTNYTSQNHMYELSLEEKVQQALVIAGAPSEIAMNWREQRAQLQRGLIFLSALARQKKINKYQFASLKEASKPPGNVSVSRVDHLSDTTSLTLAYSIQQGQNNQVSFFCIERVENGKFETLWKDPPTRTNPPSPPEGRYVVSGLEPNHSYTFRVTAFNSFGASPPKRKTFYTTPNAPAHFQASRCKYEGQVAHCILTWNNSKTSSKTSSRDARRSNSSQNVPVATISSNLTKTWSSQGSPRSVDQKVSALSTTMAGSYYEVLAYDLSIDGLTRDQTGLIVYRGKQTCCQVVGLQTGVSYKFMVRESNPHGNMGNFSNPCTVLPLAPPSVPRVRILGQSATLKWKVYEVPNEATNSLYNAVAYSQETFQLWANTSTHGGGQMNHVYKIEIKSAEYSKVHETTGTSWAIPDLSPNTKYTVRILAKCISFEGKTFESPWSPRANFETAPDQPTKPVLVEAFADSFLVRWGPPSSGCAQYSVEYRMLRTSQKASKKPKSSNKEQKGTISKKYDKIAVQSSVTPWETGYQGKSCMTRVSGLKPDTLVEVQVFATNSSGERKSVPSSILIASTLSAEEARVRIPKPSTAKNDFQLPCTRNELTLGDLVIFSEKQNIPCWRTIAGRIVKVKAKEVWIEVQWSTIDSPIHEESLVLPCGERIQRTTDDIFKYQLQLGIYRKTWADESSRSQFCR